MSFCNYFNLFRNSNHICTYKICIQYMYIHIILKNFVLWQSKLYKLVNHFFYVMALFFKQYFLLLFGTKIQPGQNWLIIYLINISYFLALINKLNLNLIKNYKIWFISFYLFTYYLWDEKIIFEETYVSTYYWVVLLASLLDILFWYLSIVYRTILIVSRILFWIIF